MPTAIAEALTRAKIDVNGAMLHSLAVEALRTHERNPHLAVKSFVDDIRAPAGALIALMGQKLDYAVIRTAAFAYLERVAADMKGRAGVQAARGSQTMGGPSKNSSQEDGSVHKPFERQRKNGVPETSEGRGSNVSVKSQVRIGPDPSPQNRNGAVHGMVESHSCCGRVVPVPNKPRSLADLKKTKAIVTPSVFDTWKVRGNRSIGDLTFGELGGLIATNHREAELLKLIRNHVKPHSETVRVRDAIKERDLQRMIQKAAELSDAA